MPLLRHARNRFRKRKKRRAPAEVRDALAAARYRVDYRAKKIADFVEETLQRLEAAGVPLQRAADGAFALAPGWKPVAGQREAVRETVRQASQKLVALRRELAEANTALQELCARFSGYEETEKSKGFLRQCVQKVHVLDRAMLALHNALEAAGARTKDAERR